VPTPKLPKAHSSVLSAEEMNGFLNQVAGMKSDSGAKDAPQNRPNKAERKLPRGNADEEGYSSNVTAPSLRLPLRCWPSRQRTHGLNLVDMDCKDRILRVRGKGNKERIGPYGSKADERSKHTGRYVSACCCKNLSARQNVAVSRTRTRFF